MASGQRSRSISTDDVNHPAHYNAGKIEVIDFIEDQNLPHHLANVIQYVCRAPHKGEELKDLKKAQWWLNRYVQLQEKALADRP